MMRPDPGLNELIIAVCRAHRARATTLLAESGLHPGQEQLLFVLWSDGPQTQSALAERLGVQAPTINKMVARMESSGLLERHAAEDGRTTHIVPSDRAAGLRAEVERLWQRLAGTSAAGLDDHELATLRDLLDRVARNLGSERPGTCS